MTISVWEQAPSWNSLIADLGVYKGPWPQPVPLMQNLPLDAGEVDYIVALPNPDGIAEHVGDGSYATMFSQTWTYWTGTPGADFNTNTVLNATGGAVDDGTMPVGAHLFVLWYNLTFDSPSAIDPPSLDALQLVPPDWVTGGAGWASSPTEGRWSDWIAGDTQSHPALKRHVTIQGEGQSYGDPTISGPGVHSLPGDIGPYSTDALAATRAGTGTRLSSPGGVFGGTEVQLEAAESWATANSSGLGLDYCNWETTALLQQGVTTYSGAGWETTIESSSTALDGLVEGLDYGPNPITGLEFDYETDTATPVGWEDWPVVVIDGGNSLEVVDYSSVGPPGSITVNVNTDVTTHPAATMTFRVLSAPIITPTTLVSDTGVGAVVDSTLPWVAPGDGTLVATYTQNVSAGISHPTVDTVVVPLSTHLGAVDTFTIVSRPDFADTGTVPWSDFAVPAFDSTTRPATEIKERFYKAQVKAANVDSWLDTILINSFYGSSIADPALHATLPQIVYQKPRWRYWIPAFIAPPAEPGPFWPGFKLDSGFKGSAVNFSGSGF